MAERPAAGESKESENTRANLQRLLTQMIEQPERRNDIIKQIEETFSQRRAIMVVDMSGFSRTTQRHGIVLFLLMIHQTHLLVKPAIANNDGLVVKTEADNVFSLFDTVADAVGAGLEITDRLKIANVLLPEDRRLYVSVGIGYGNLLNVEDEDVFGDEMNLASKLGEDVAEMGQILLTPNARASLEGSDIPVEEHQVSISGLSLPYYAVRTPPR